jgi:hypothetical protein
MDIVNAPYALRPILAIDKASCRARSERKAIRLMVAIFIWSKKQRRQKERGRERVKVEDYKFNSCDR